MPSGLEAQLHEILDAGDGAFRARYVAPGFDAAASDPEILLSDMNALCERAVTLIMAEDANLRHVTVSVADRPAEFGVLDTEVNQSFEAFGVTDGVCIWEAF